MNSEIIVVDNVFVRVSTADVAQGAIWFIHGFGESSLSFTDVFSGELRENFDLFAPDFPGFGVTPFRPHAAGLENAAALLHTLIKTVSKTRKIYLVAHSLGGVIGTWTAQALGRQVCGFFNIEGNLTTADAYFTGLACNYDSEEVYFNEFLQAIYTMAPQEKALQRYYAALWFADPAALMQWGRSAAFHSRDDKPGHEFAALPCRKLYYWGAVRTPAETKRFIESAAIPNKQFPGTSHWPMVEDPGQCSKDIIEFFLKAD